MNNIYNFCVTTAASLPKMISTHLKTHMHIYISLVESVPCLKVIGRSLQGESEILTYHRVLKATRPRNRLQQIHQPTDCAETSKFNVCNLMLRCFQFTFDCINSLIRLKFSLRKQPKKSTSILSDGYTFWRLFWKSKHTPPPPCPHLV